MNRNRWRYLVDSLLFISLVGIVIIGILMGLVIPKGQAANEGAKYFLGLHRHEWGNIHFYLATAFVALIIVHLAFNWSWIKCQARHIFNRQWVAALVLTVIASIIVLFILWYFYPKNSARYGGHSYGREHGELYDGNGQHCYALSEDGGASAQVIRIKRHGSESKKSTSDSPFINGKMTLTDVEQVTGVPGRKIAEQLGLPVSVPLNERLGRLRRRYGFSTEDVRNAVISLLKDKDRLAEDW